jgi:hypothetical protein
MQRLSVIIASLAFSVCSHAQFSITPTDSIAVVVNADSIYSNLQIDMVNELTDSLQLTWRLIEEIKPEGWAVNLCDLGECYSGVPGTADMQPAGPGENGYLKLVLSPLSIVGYGFWHFWVYPTGDEDNFVNIYFSVTSEVIDGVEIVEEKLWSVGPNPASDHFYISGPSDERPELVQLFSASGSLIFELKPSSHFLDVSYLPPGIYLLAIHERNETAPVITKVVID